MSSSWRTVSTKARFTEIDSWKLAAKQQNKSVAGWIRDTLNKAAITNHAGILFGVEVLTDEDRTLLRFAARAAELERDLEHTRRELARRDVELAKLRERT